MREPAMNRPRPVLPVTYPVYPPALYGSAGREPDQPAVPVSHYFWILRRYRWKMAAFVAACTIGTLIVSKRLTPIYESTATIDIDRRMPLGVLGEDSVQQPVQDSDEFLATQMSLIQSDSVLRPVVKRFGLRSDDLEDAGKAGTAAGEDAAVKLKKLKVVRPPNTQLLQISFRSPDPRQAAEVANAVVSSYIQHTYNIRFRAAAGLSQFMEKQLDELKAKMEQSSDALVKFERDLNVINPEEKTNILSSRLLQLNTEYTNAQSERVKREAAFNSVRSGNLDAARVSTQGEALKRLAERLDDADEKFAQIKAHFGAGHPEYRRAAAQLAQIRQQVSETTASIARQVEIEYLEAVKREKMLKQAVSETKAEFDALNSRSFQYQALRREAEADKKLYEELVTKIKQSTINAAFQNSTIRLADPARPALRPVFPNVKLNLLLALLASSMLAVGAALLSDLLDNSIRDPEQVRTLLGTDVLGSLPLVKGWEKRGRLRPNAARPAQPAAPVCQITGNSLANGSEPFREAVRTLRNSILLGTFETPLKSLLVTSASSAEGKTTTAVHLALSHAQLKHRTLLIDCDLRRPSVARALGVPNENGLAAVLSNGMLWRPKLVHLDDVPDLDILPAGVLSGNTLDLVGQNLPRILDEAAADYDLIIVDAPPLLGFSEPLQLATFVDGVVVVSVAGTTNRKALNDVFGTLKRLRANVLGLVLNGVSHEGSNGYYGYEGYSQEYRASAT